MENILKLFQIVLYEIDFFKTPFYFTLNHSRNKLSTRLGSFFSFMIIILLFYLFFSSDMVLKQNPAVVSQTKTVGNRPEFSFTNSNFSLNFQIFDKQFKSYEINPSLFKIYIHEILLYYDENQTIQEIVTEKNFSLCKNSMGQITYCMEDSFMLEG